MSRGLGPLQRDVLDVLRGERGLMTWIDLKERFPFRVRNHSLNRTVRSLERRGLIRVMEVNGRRWIASCAPAVWSRADQELENLCVLAIRSVEILAKARGVPVPEEVTEWRAMVDAYRRGTQISD